MTIRNRFGDTITEVIDRTLKEENEGGWVGEVESVELTEFNERK